MKSFLQILVLALIITSCKKSELSGGPSTVTWELNSSVDWVREREFDKIIEYYDENNMITHKEFYKAGNLHTDTYKYDKDRQLIEFDGELKNIYKYYYENGLKVKREMYDNELISLQDYKVYEYSNSVLEKSYYFNRDSILKSTLLYYYSSNKLDSIYHYYLNNLDSIEGKEIYSYDANKNLVETNGWKWSKEEQKFYRLGKEIFNCKNNIRTRLEVRDSNNKILGLIYEYKYDFSGKMNKIEIYHVDGLVGYYNATFSSGNNKYIIPEL
ncbi:MAG: hypothetical protein K0M40_21055 [Prolixibacteraceae bacterium]|nr:hypothetical protein [Prolixibacteraceae bacterium]